MRAFITTLCATGLLALGVTGVAAAQPQQGLVNVNIEDVVVAVPINAAANICGVEVNVLSAALVDAGFYECDARSNQDVTITN
jgi:hypothetical protein